MNLSEWTFGIPEEAFAHRKPKLGLITKTEVRVISLSKMALREKSVVWDIGAGSGSVSIESALLARAGRVFAIEKNEEDVGLIRENIRRFGTTNVEAIHAKAPDRLDDLPPPDAVFIGGSGSRMEEILEICWRRLNEQGRLVVNLATIENLSEAYHFFKRQGIRPEATLVQIGRGSEILDLTRFDALNPVFILMVEKGLQSDAGCQMSDAGKTSERSEALRGRLHPAPPVEGATQAPLIDEEGRI